MFQLGGTGRIVLESWPLLLLILAQEQLHSVYLVIAELVCFRIFFFPSL